MSNREPMKNDVPELWRQRAKAGLCPVCGKTPQEFDKGLKIYCSVKCRDEYASKYTFWTTVRDKFLSKHGEFCDKCSITAEKFDAIRKKYLEEMRRQWLLNPKNKLMIEQKRDELLVEWSKAHEERYKRIMDDAWILDDAFWDEDRELKKELPDRIWFELDHIIALCNGGDMWDQKNYQVLCSECHKLKTAVDMKEMKRKREKTGIIEQGTTQG